MSKKKNTIKQYLTKFDETIISEAQQCLIAAEIKEVQKKKKNEIAFCYLTGSYLIRDNEIEIEFRKELQLKAKNNLIASLANNEYEDKTVFANIYYLIAEMERRIGNFDEAVKYYDFAINDANKKNGSKLWPKNKKNWQ